MGCLLCGHAHLAGDLTGGTPVPLFKLIHYQLEGRADTVCDMDQDRAEKSYYRSKNLNAALSDLMT